MAQAAALQWEKFKYIEIAVQESIEKQQARQSSEWKSLLVAEVAHDLRSPLNTILWKLKNLQRKLPAEPGDKNQPIQNIQSQVNRVLSFVQNLLLLSNLEEGKLNVQKQVVPVKPSVLDVLDGLQAIISLKAIHIDFHCANRLSIKGDTFIFQEILLNFIENAAKYSPEKSTIFISAERVEAEERQQVRITISDEGGGIPQDVIKNLQQPPNNELEIKGDQKGFRLGLYIAHQFVGVLGGEIHIESVPERGTKVNLLFENGEI